LLPLLGAASQQDHQHIPVSPEMNPTPRSLIDLIFEHAPTDRLDVREITLFEPSQRHRHLRCRRRIKVGEPVFERTLSVAGKVIAQLNRELR
jgi:hypothetical protein